jgi:hypothetical protein
MNIWQYNPFAKVRNECALSVSVLHSTHPRGCPPHSTPPHPQVKGWPALVPAARLGGQAMTIHCLVCLLPKRYGNETMQDMIAAYYAARRIELTAFQKLATLKVTKVENLMQVLPLTEEEKRDLEPKEVDEYRLYLEASRKEEADIKALPEFTGWLPIQYSPATEAKAKEHVEAVQANTRSVRCTDDQKTAADALADLQVQALQRASRVAKQQWVRTGMHGDAPHDAAEGLTKEKLSVLWRPRAWTVLPYTTVNNEPAPIVAYTDYHRGHGGLDWNLGYVHRHHDMPRDAQM